MTRRNDVAAGRTSRPTVLSTIYQALLGSGPPEGARDRLDQVRTILDARDDDAALGLVAVYETYLALAHRRMRSAVRVIAAMAVAQVLIIVMFGWGMVLFLNHLLSQNVSAITATTIRQTYEDEYGEDILSIARYFKFNINQHIIASASSQLTPDEVYRLAQMQDLKDRLATVARLSADQWRAAFNISAGDQKGIRQK